MYLSFCGKVLVAVIMGNKGLIKHFQEYWGAITLAAVLLLVWYLAQLPVNLWLPGYSLLPLWLQDRSILLVVATYYVYIIIPAFLLGTAIFVLKVWKKL